jgi:hypothetical protein
LLKLGVGLDASIATLVATLDLQLVKAITGAMNAVNANAGNSCGKAIDGVPISHKRDCFESRPVIDPTPRILPRKVYHPTPRIEPRPVFHPTPRIEPRNAPAAVPPSTEPAPCEKTKSPLLPPWKTLPCEVKEPAPLQIKMIVQRPDIHHKGSLIDLFI